jgi:hypothetical protein
MIMKAAEKKQLETEAMVLAAGVMMEQYENTSSS